MNKKRFQEQSRIRKIHGQQCVHRKIVSRWFRTVIAFKRSLLLRRSTVALWEMSFPLFRYKSLSRTLIWERSTPLSIGSFSFFGRLVLNSVSLELSSSLTLICFSVVRSFATDLPIRICLVDLPIRRQWFYVGFHLNEQLFSVQHFNIEHWGNLTLLSCRIFFVLHHLWKHIPALLGFVLF